VEIKYDTALIKGGKGQLSEKCMLEFNSDVEGGPCSICIKPDGTVDEDGRCAYCTGLWSHRTNEAYTIRTMKEPYFEEKVKLFNIIVLRIGKVFECGHPLTRKALYILLELCVKYGVRPIVTSKLLEFDQKIADLIIASQGIVHISLGCDTVELGAVLQGATNAIRLERAKQYQQVGCPVLVRIVADVTLPMEPFHKEVLRVMGVDGILLTPLTYTGIDVLSYYRADSWYELKTSGEFSQTRKNLYPNKIHPDWDPIKNRCGKIGAFEYCNDCGLKNLGIEKKSYKEQLRKLGWKAATYITKKERRARKEKKLSRTEKKLGKRTMVHYGCPIHEELKGDGLCFIVDVEPGTYDVLQFDGTYKRVVADSGRLDVPCLDPNINIIEGQRKYGLFKEAKK
jgi:hypothetical protein